MSWLEAVAAPIAFGLISAPCYIAYNHGEAYRRLIRPIRLVLALVFIAIGVFNIGYQEGSAAAGKRLGEPIPLFLAIIAWTLITAYTEICASWVSTLKSGDDQVRDKSADTNAD